MIGRVGAQRPDEADVVHVLRRFRKDFADLDAALSAGLKLERRRQRRARGPFGGEVACGDRLAGPFGERGFGVEGVHLRRSAIQVDVNDVPCTCGEVRRFGREGICGRRHDRRHQYPGVAQQSGESDHPEARAHLPEHLPAGEEARGEVLEQVHIFLINEQRFVRYQKHLGQLLP